MGNEIKFVKNDMNFKLDQFEGPLDLLLHLIRDAKIDIKEIFLSKITEQYLKYMEEIESIDVDKAGDFIEMAATLLEIKSRNLIPKEEEAAPDPESEEQKLIKRLEEYKLFKEQSEKLKVIENVDRFYKEPDATVGNVHYVLGSLSFDGLLKSFAEMLHRVSVKAEIPEPKKIEKEKFTVAQKISQIKDSLIEKKKIKFTELFVDSTDRIEVINTFLALLELLKSQVVSASQDDVFGDIWLEPRKAPLTPFLV